MNRSEMRAVLAAGGTVLHKGRHIKAEEDLPTEGELALDTGNEEAALKSVDKEIARLTAEKEALEQSASEKKAKAAAAGGGEETKTAKK